MRRYLLDTNVLSEVLKKRPSDRVRTRLASASDEELSTSSVCVMELRFGAVRHRDEKMLWDRIRTEILGRVTILAVGRAEAIRAGELLAALEKEGRPIGTEDVLIGATALTHGLAVATRNVRHFGQIAGLTVEDWWS